jgi:hypothetical protein
VVRVRPFLVRFPGMIFGFSVSAAAPSGFMFLRVSSKSSRRRHRGAFVPCRLCCPISLSVLICVHLWLNCIVPVSAAASCSSCLRVSSKWFPRRGAEEEPFLLLCVSASAVHPNNSRKFVSEFTSRPTIYAFPVSG